MAAKKRNPADSTLRNTRASRRRDEDLQEQIAALTKRLAAVEERVSELEAQQ